MITKKEELVLKAIENYSQKNGVTPTIRELCGILNYKSTKTIYKYIKILKQKNMLHYTPQKKRTIVVNQSIKESLLVINTKKLLHLPINSNIIIFQIKNDFFKNYSIEYNDYLIIDTKKNIKNSDLGLFLVRNKYHIMKYNYLDGYYILENNEKEFFNQINLIGTVVGIYRNQI